MPRKKQPANNIDDHVSRGLTYARAVVAGEILAGKYTRLACARQLRDVERDNFTYKFDRDRANAVCEFLEMLPHTKGKWAARRENIRLEPWQCFLFSTLFGWIDDDGLRRFREAYLCVARKNGKSLIAAGIGLYMLGIDGEHGAEVYSGATTEKQAWEVFKPARLMAQKTPDFCEYAGIDVLAKSLIIAETGGKFECVIGDPGDGSSPSCSIIDEYHEHQHSNLYDTMRTGMGAREQPLLLIITTAGSNIAGPCHEKQRDVERLLDGEHTDDRQFGLIYHADESDDWTSDDAIKKANPNLGVSVSLDYLRAQSEDAKRNPRKASVYRTKHLNLWVNAKGAWVNLLAWNQCADASLNIEDFSGDEMIGSIDLATRVDMAAYVRLFTRVVDGRRHYYAFPRFYLPEAAVYSDKTGRYIGWVNAGLLTVTPGDEIEFAQIEDDVKLDLEQFSPREYAYDPWKSTYLAQRLSAEGANLIEFRQTVATMSEPMKEFEAAITSGRFHHDGNAILTWMASNVVAKLDAKDNIYPRKEKVENKIDGIVAIIMGIGRVMYEQPESTEYVELRIA
jgi:phage terminase large subunit-like protein